MIEHEKNNPLLAFYVSGKLADEERIQVRAHLEKCAACQEEVKMWQDISDVMVREYQSVKAPQEILKNVLESTQENETIPKIFLKFWKIVVAQVPLVKRDIWPASLLVLVLGFVITLIADQARFLFAIAPLVSAGGLAFIYSMENDPAFELVLSTPISQIQILLARSALVFGYNFFLMVILSWGLSLNYPTDLILPLIMEWLAPMTFLSTLGLCISIISNSENAILIAYFFWLGKYLMVTPEFKKLFGLAGDMFLLFWQTPMVLYIVSVSLFVIMLMYLHSSPKFTQKLT